MQSGLWRSETGGVLNQPEPSWLDLKLQAERSCVIWSSKILWKFQCTSHPWFEAVGLHSKHQAKIHYLIFFTLNQFPVNFPACWYDYQFILRLHFGFWYQKVISNYISQGEIRLIIIKAQQHCLTVLVKPQKLMLLLSIVSREVDHSQLWMRQNLILKLNTMD